jgi:thymidylate synthase (FAD)|tara:strand:- start:239 stop:883 length:645 start_codon:yes stop_codon:yes gene_type:complete
MKVTLIDRMGNDLSVANAARVSFDKKHERLTEGDKKLIRYLAKHGHWTPFAHTALSFRIDAPIFVARQLVKHQIGLSWNEISRRYVDYEPDYWMPDHWRGRPVDKKQGSSEEFVDWLDRDIRTGSAVIASCEHAIETYNKMIEAGVAPEQARVVLPQNTYTSWIWTGSLYAFARVCNLRCQPDAQEESRDVCWKINNLSSELFPVSWEALRSAV